MLASISIVRYGKRTNDPKNEFGPVGCLIHLLLERAYVVWNVSSYTINVQSARKAAEITMARSIGERVFASESREIRSSLFKWISSSLRTPSRYDLRGAMVLDNGKPPSNWATITPVLTSCFSALLDVSHMVRTFEKRFEKHKLSFHHHLSQDIS